MAEVGLNVCLLETPLPTDRSEKRLELIPTLHLVSVSMSDAIVDVILYVSTLPL